MSVYNLTWVSPDPSGSHQTCRTFCLLAERNTNESIPKGRVASGDVDKPDAVYAGSTGKFCPNLPAWNRPTYKGLVPNAALWGGEVDNLIQICQMRRCIVEVCVRAKRNPDDSMPKGRVASSEVDKPVPLYARSTRDFCPSLLVRVVPHKKGLLPHPALWRGEGK